MKKVSNPNKSAYEHRKRQNYDIYEGISPDFSGQDLSRKNLKAASLGHANLREANLTGAYMNGAILTNADLRGANLLGANLELTSLDGTLIDEQTQMDAKWRLVWKLVNNKMDTLDLSGLDLRYVRLIDMDLSKANLSNSDLTGSILRRVDFQNANLCGSILKDLHDLTCDVILHGVTVDEKTIMDEREWLVWSILNQGAEGKQLHGVNLSCSYLKQANFRNANLSEADLHGNILEEANFSNANLRHADLKVASLQGSCFDGADLRGTILFGANLQRTDLETAQIDDSTDLFAAKYDNETRWPKNVDPVARIVNRELWEKRRK